MTTREERNRHAEVKLRREMHESRRVRLQSRDFAAKLPAKDSNLVKRFQRPVCCHLHQRGMGIRRRQSQGEGFPKPTYPSPGERGKTDPAYRTSSADVQEP